MDHSTPCQGLNETSTQVARLESSLVALIDSNNRMETAVGKMLDGLGTVINTHSRVVALETEGERRRSSNKEIWEAHRDLQNEVVALRAAADSNTLAIERRGAHMWYVIQFAAAAIVALAGAYQVFAP